MGNLCYNLKHNYFTQKIEQALLNKTVQKIPSILFCCAVEIVDIIESSYRILSKNDRIFLVFCSIKGFIKPLLENTNLTFV